MTVTIRKERSDKGRSHDYPDDRKSRGEGRKHNYPKYRATRTIDHLIYVPSLKRTYQFSNFYNPDSLQEIVARLDGGEDVEVTANEMSIDIRTAKRVEVRLAMVKKIASKKLVRLGGLK